MRPSVATSPLWDARGRGFRKVGVKPMHLFYQQLCYPTLHCCVTHDRTVREEKYSRTFTYTSTNQLTQHLTFLLETKEGWDP